MLFDAYYGASGCSDSAGASWQGVPAALKTPRFESEAALVQAAKLGFAPSLGDVYGLTDEFDCNDGIADLVLYRRRRDWILSEGLQLLSPRWAAALYALPYRRGFSAEWFGEVNLVTRRRAIQVLQEYESAGFCKRLDTAGAWVKFRQPRPLVSQIYAIEAKLRDWRRALSQAARYRAFAHQAWVLLDGASIKPAVANLDRFVGLNVGLASISTDGKFHHYHTPQKRSPSDPWRFWFANVLIARDVAKLNDVDSMS